MESAPQPLTDPELIAALRKAASHWFNNTQLHLLEEFIRRYEEANAKSRITSK